MVEDGHCKYLLKAEEKIIHLYDGWGRFVSCMVTHRVRNSRSEKLCAPQTTSDYENCKIESEEAQLDLFTLVGETGLRDSLSAENRSLLFPNKSRFP